MTRLWTLFLLSVFLPSVAAARSTSLSEVEEPAVDKTVAEAYGSMLAGIASPILIGSALAKQGGDGIGMVLILGGVLVGPSTGQFYAQSYGTGMLSTGLRVGSIALMAVGMYSDFPAVGEALGLGLYLLSLGGFTAGTVYSLVDTRRAVERYRVRVREKRVGFTPTLTPSQGELRPGAMAWMRF